MTITRDSLLTLEAYAKARKAHKPQIIAHRRLRSVQLGEHINLQFEDEQTIRYQIQEMLRIEKIFEEEGIQSEIEAYAPLVPDGSNWKATMLIEYPDAHERKRELARLIGVEDRLFVEVEGHARVYAIADEDLDRENDEKTSAVHFVRFEFTPAARSAVRAGAAVRLGCDHRTLSGACDHPARDPGQPGRRPGGALSRCLCIRALQRCRADRTAAPKFLGGLTHSGDDSGSYKLKNCCHAPLAFFGLVRRRRRACTENRPCRRLSTSDADRSLSR